jgi:ParB-like chromosome segregation protein Spo0J
MFLAMPAIIQDVDIPKKTGIPVSRLELSPFSLDIYGDPASEINDLLASVREYGILVPLVVAAGVKPKTWEVLSGNRRLACAIALDLKGVPCEVVSIPAGAARQRAILEYNRQRRKSFSQLMREADALETLYAAEAKKRRLANLRAGSAGSFDHVRSPDGRNSDDRRKAPDIKIQEREGSPKRASRTDAAVAQQIGIGGKDVYRQARAIWQHALSGDSRAQNNIAQLDAGTKTIHAAYKDLRRRDRFNVGFQPTPYDVWNFRHDRAFGIPHPGSIPPSIVAHALHYFTAPGALVVDPMAGGGTTYDVAQSMGRRCLAYDLECSRPEIIRHDIRNGFPAETIGCDLIFCDPPYHTMLGKHYPADSAASLPLLGWVQFLNELAAHALRTLKPGGRFVLLLAPQTEKDLPRGVGYIDHVFFGYTAALRAGFLPERRISCPMDGAYLPQHVRRARLEGRLLGQVRDLLVMRKPSQEGDIPSIPLSFLDATGLA